MSQLGRGNQGLSYPFIISNMAAPKILNIMDLNLVLSVSNESRNAGTSQGGVL